MGVGQLIRNVGEALKLTNARTIATTGDATYSVSFDGSANVSSAITLATVNSNVGAFGGAGSIPVVTVNGKGQITAVSTNSIGNELIAIQALADSAGFLKKTGDGNYSIDNNNYLPLSGGTVTGDLVSTSATASTSTTTGAIRGASLGITGAVFAGTVNRLALGAGVDTTSVKIGANSGAANIAGLAWTAVGISAGASCTGNSWTAIGAYSGVLNTTGVGWTAIGMSAGYSIIGNSWTAIGNNAGRYLSDGITALTASSNSCFIGFGTKGTQNATNEQVFGYNATGNGSNTMSYGDSSITNNFFRGALSLNGTQVISTRRTGWSAPTGTATRTTFATSTVTLPQLAERVKALIDDLINHGLIGA